LNNNKLINEKLICAFRWSVLPSIMKMHGPKNKSNNDLLIYKISSTCFGQYFAHHQERLTEIFTAYMSVSRSW